MNRSNFEKFYYHKNYTYSFHSAKWNHRHGVNAAYCNTLTIEQISSIKEHQKLNVLSGEIRSNLDVTVSPNIRN